MLKVTVMKRRKFRMDLIFTYNLGVIFLSSVTTDLYMYPYHKNTAQLFSIPLAKKKRHFLIFVLAPPFAFDRSIYFQ